MSAVNVFVSSKRACVLTDSSLYDAEGTIVDFALKTYAIDSWNGAITGRGNWWGPTFTRDIAEAYGSFDEFLTGSAAEIERAHRVALETDSLDGQKFVEIHAVGWSEKRDRPEAYVLTSPRAGLTDDVRPYVWISLEAEDGIFHCVHMSPREWWQLHRQGAEPGEDWTAESFDPVLHGIPVLEAQRRKPAGPEAGKGVAGKHVIGGDLWLTVVDREGVRQGVILEWGDKPGEPIRPKPLDESSLPEIVPSGFAESCTYAEFTDFLLGGMIDPETFEWDQAQVDRIQAVANGATPGEVAAAMVAAAAEEPVAAPITGTRRQRRAAKAHARKGGLARV